MFRGESQVAVARAFGVTPVAAHRWFQVWQAQGKAGLKAAGRLGRKPALDGAQLAQFDAALAMARWPNGDWQSPCGSRSRCS